ncbi:MAG: response regulator transcription factor [Bryobacteraceae bacterium]
MSTICISQNSELAGTAPVDATIPKTKVLFVQNDGTANAEIQNYLQSQGLSVETVGDLEGGLIEACSGNHDLLLLDAAIGFPADMPNQPFAQISIPVIVLGTSDEVADRVTALEAGADDCLTRQCSVIELAARIRAVLRRTTEHKARRQPQLQVNGVTVDPNSRQAWHNGKDVPLTSVEYQILEILVRHAGRTVSRSEVARELYHRDWTPFDRCIDVHISHLRKKLGGRRNLIRTVRSIGYFFCLDQETAQAC